MKNLVLLLTALLLASPLFAQKGLHLGVRVAPQLTYYNNPDDNDAGESLDIVFPAGGVQGGLSVDYHFSDNVGVGLNFLFSGQRAKYEGKTVIGNTTVSSFEGTNRFSYFKIPLLFTFNTNPSGGSMLLLSTGPQLSFLTNATQEVVVTSATGSKQTFTEKDLDYTLRDSYTSPTFDWVFNIGARFKVADNMFIDAGFRFDYTLVDVEDKDFSYSVSGSNQIKPWEFEQGGKNRKASSWITAGLNLGFTYVIPY